MTGHQHEFFDNWPSDLCCTRCGRSQDHTFMWWLSGPQQVALAAASGAASEADYYGGAI